MHTRRERLMRFLAALLNTARRAENGQGIVEYAAILTFVAAVMVVAILYLGPNIANTINNVANSF